jgi:PAS domain S-box-containing protein
MGESPRKSGIDIIGDVPWGTHFCQFYKSGEDLTELLVPYFKAGLDNNELCVWVISQALEIEDAKKAMKCAVPDIDVYLENGQMEIVPYAHGYLKEGIFDPDWIINNWIQKIDSALARGYDGLRIAGDNRWLEKEGWNGFLDYENKADAILDKCHVIALCPYYLNMCSTAEIIEVVSNHQFALIKRNGKWELIENSGRRKAEKEAIQAAKNWEYTFDAVPDLIAIIDDNYRIVRANRAMATRLGMAPEEYTGETCYRLVHGTDIPPSFCPHKQLLKDGAGHTAEVFEAYLGGYFTINTSPLHDSEGRLAGSVCVAHDLNERKKVEERLKESEEKYRTIVETANEGILIIDAEVRITYANKKIAEMLGYRLEELIGRSLWDFADEESNAVLNLNLEKRRQNINEVYELKLICKDGSPLWALINAKAFFNKEGGFTGSLGMLTDITERKQEEHRIRRYNRILEGINRIFSNVVQAKTEEEVGKACLSVALELTGSKFGFINEMGTDGLLHDVAKSELGWEQCFIYDKAGHRRSPNVFAVHGLYGSVINNERGFFTNDPPAHPDSIGLPSGHPPITSFLGVPLVQEGKAAGLIAVANREGGYSCEQQEDLEAIAPVVVQALQRKKAEQKRKQAEEALRVSEERYRSLYENSLDGILLTKPDGTILCANPQACQMFGMTEDEIIQAGREGLVVNDEKLAAALEERRLTGRARAELTYRRKDGSTFVCDVTSKLFMGADGDLNTSQILRDISERKKAEEALQASEEKFRQIVETASEGIWLTDSNGRTVFVNRKLSEMLGYSIEEILGQSPRKFISPEFLAKVDDRLHEHMQGVYRVVDYRLIRKDGSGLWCMVSSSPIFDDNGKYAGSLAMITDITERKRVEEALRFSNLYNRSLIEASLDPLVTIGRDGKITDVNGATEEVTGYSRHELIGTDFSEYFVDPEIARTGYRRVFTDGEVRDYPLEIRHKDGHITPVLYNVSVYRDEKGEVIGVFAAARDITERKRAEHQLSNELARATGLYELYTRSSNLSDGELYDFALNQAVKITDSTIGFFHRVSEDEKEIILTTWNQEALRSCTAGKEGHYPIEKAGNWVDCVRLKQPVVYNDFPSSPNRKGLPAGHATVKRFMSVPVTENGKVRIIFGVGNKVDEYDDRDVMQLQLVANELHKIMKLRRIENEVRESEAFLRDIMENVSDAIFVKDREARMILANTAYYRLMGKSPEEVLNKTFADFHLPEIARKLAEDDKRVMETGKGTTLEERIFTSHGWRILQTVKAPYYDGQGNIIGLIGAARDITERKKAEEALKEAHDNLEKLIEERTTQLEKAYNSLKESEEGLAEAQRMAHIGNWDLNLVTGKGYWSEELYRIFRRNPQEPAPSYKELLDYVHPEDRAYVDKSIQNGLKKEPKSGIDYRIVLADGKERIVHSRAEVLFDKQKNPIQVKGIVQDITERKRIEAELELVARLSQENPDPVMRLDKGLIINYANPAAQVLLTDWDSTIGKEAPREITAPSVAALGDGIRRILECSYANRTYMIDIAPFPGAGYVNLYAHDITESKKAKEALEKIDKIRIKEIHHRIKNNLQVISSLLNLQAERFRNKEVLEAFRESQDRITSMSLIHEELYKGEKNDTLNFSVYLQKLAENLFQTYSFKSKNVRLFMDLEENTLFDIDVSVPLGIIVNELVSNSLKHAFTEEKEGEIRIKLCREEKDNETSKSPFSLIISDNGKGIPENIELERLESLGLQLVSALVDQLDGKIELKRKHGTEFRITFNVAERP